ncbi:kinesin-like protein KIN-7K, chloroplastic [Arachis ipaensis]|uniref:kinesin-like protein KIN-7K, chloroplastic n=1 Tax=Arachis ipaensis TaxID=130454 RepID=UPI000A2B3FE6|nr:kinesin-like protein KIN-7K, chloroplastic [Arachis ipaensis]
MMNLKCYCSRYCRKNAKRGNFVKKAKWWKEKVNIIEGKHINPRGQFIDRKNILDKGKMVRIDKEVEDISSSRKVTRASGIKEEVVLSPAHALSLIAAGEEHKHVGSTNFNLLSSRSHTIFTLGRREGSYINKSLLTLGTVISKLTEDKPSHIPYRDSKLTRLLQSSLSGHLICTVTPSLSSTEETHNTLKFAHRAKHIEIQAAQNKY